MLRQDAHFAFHAGKIDDVDVAFKILASGVMISSLSVAMAGRSGVDRVDVALHIEVAFVDVIVLAVENFLEALHGVPDRN